MPSTESRPTAPRRLRRSNRPPRRGNRCVASVRSARNSRARVPRRVVDLAGHIAVTLDRQATGCRLVVRSHLGDHPHRSLTKLTGIRARAWRDSTSTRGPVGSRDGLSARRWSLGWVGVAAGYGGAAGDAEFGVDDAAEVDVDGLGAEVELLRDLRLVRPCPTSWATWRSDQRGSPASAGCVEAVGAPWVLGCSLACGICRHSQMQCPVDAWRT